MIPLRGKQFLKQLLTLEMSLSVFWDIFQQMKNGVSPTFTKITQLALKGMSPLMYPKGLNFRNIRLGFFIWRGSAIIAPIPDALRLVRAMPFRRGLKTALSLLIRRGAAVTENVLKHVLTKKQCTDPAPALRRNVLPVIRVLKERIPKARGSRWIHAAWRHVSARFVFRGW